MGLMDLTVNLLTYISEGIHSPESPAKITKKSTLDEDIVDTSDLWLETQRMASGLRKFLKVDSLKDKKQRMLTKIKSRYSKLNKAVHQAEFMRTKDKLVFMSTCINVALASYLLGKYPCYFYIYYIIMASIFIPLRFITYRLQNYHYFMFDFCYYANLNCILYLYFYPDSQILYNINLAFAYGPMLLAVPLFTNSFVPHSVDKLTSLVIHVLPGLSLWGLRTGNCGGFNMTMFEPYYFFSYSIMSYLLWLVIYYLVIFVMTYERCQRKGNLTMYTYAMEDHTRLTYKFCGLLGERFRHIMFITQHAMSNLILFVCAFVFVLNYSLLSVVLLVTMSWSAWNGGNYYIELFARRYEKDIMKIHEIYSNIDK